MRLISRAIISCIVASLLLFMTSVVIGQQVDFDVNSQTGCLGFNARFSDLSSSPSDPIVSWRWDLGGPISTLRNPGRIFTQPGIYNICLRVTTQSGQSDELCKPNYIEIFSLPEANFLADNLLGCNPQFVNFQDLSSSPNGEVISWSWRLGGSNNRVITSDAAEPISTMYSQSGLYTVSLLIKDEKGCRHTTVKDDYIEIRPTLDIDFAADETFGCNLPHIVQFSNLTLDDPNITYRWDFGNQTFYNGYNPAPVAYIINGRYDVMVTSHNLSTGCRDTLIRPEFIEVGGDPLPIIVSDTSGCAPFSTTVKLDFFQSTDSVVWNFGDGYIETGFELSHTYTNPGCYTISVIKYGSGCEFGGQIEHCILVHPEMDYTASILNANGCETPHSAALVLESTQALDVKWFVDDVLVSEDLTHNLGVLSFGNYPVRLELTNQFGCEERLDLDPIIIMPLTLSLESPLNGCVPLTGSLDYQSNSIWPMATWDWEIYDGNNVIFSSSLENPPFTITDVGIYDVRLIATNETGCTDTIMAIGHIRGGNRPNVLFEATPITACLADTIFFTDQTNLADSWLWDFGNGEISSDQHPSLNYTDPGIYSVTLMAQHHGCPGTFSIPNYIEIIEPKADFTHIIDCSNPLVVEFQNISSGVDSVHWDFDFVGSYDASLDTTYSPQFDFRDAGTYQVSLTVFNFITNCQHTKTMEIVTGGPVAQFNLNKTIGCSPLQIQISDLSMHTVEWQYYLNNNLINSNGLINEPNLEIINPGLYNDMRLIVIDQHACRDTFDLNQDIRVSYINPEILSTPNPSCLGDTITFTDNSNSLFAPIVSRDWIIEDVSDTLHLERISHTFDSRGVRNVHVFLANSWGCTADTIQSFEISMPQLNFSYDSLTCTSTEVELFNLSAGSSLMYEWDFGDQTNSTESMPTHTYMQEGNYNICLRAIDQWGCIDEHCGPTIEIKDPQARFIANPISSDCPPLVVNFENQSSNYLKSFWNFGDGNVERDIDSPEHTYFRAGQYDVQLTVELTEQCRDTLVIPAYIKVNGPEGEFTFLSEPQCGSNEVTFIASSSVDYVYMWDFGDGSIETNGQIKQVDTVVHIYNEVGNYSPFLILTDNTGCELMVKSQELIFVHDIYLDFYIEEERTCELPIILQTYNFSHSSDLNTQYYWLLNGPIQDTIFEIQPVLDLNIAGAYTLTLIAENNYCTKTFEYPTPILIGLNPDANFDQVNPIYCQDEFAIFEDRSDAVFGHIISRRWLLDNTVIGADSILEISFGRVGNFEFSLEIETNYGCTNIFTQNIEVSPSPIANIIESQLICLGDSISLQAEIRPNQNIINSSWYRGNTLLCDQCDRFDTYSIQDEIYTFVMTSTEGCITTYNVEIEILNVPEISIQPDTSICKYDEIRLSLYGALSSDLIRWDMSDLGLSCYQNCSNPRARPLIDTWFNVAVSNQAGCSAEDSILISVVSDEADLGVEDHVICADDSIRLTSPSGELYQWVTDEDNCDGCSEFLLSPINSTVVYIESLGPLSCPLRDSAIVAVKPLDAVSAGEDLIICHGELIILEAIGQGTGEVLWTSNVPISDPNENVISVQPDTTTSYHLQITEDRCTQWDTVILTVERESSIKISGDTICAGDTAWVQFAGLFDRLEWSHEPDIIQEDQAGFVLFESLNLSVIASYRTCIPDEVSIQILVLPRVEIDMLGNIMFYPDEEIEIDVGMNYNGVFDVIWTPDLMLPCDNCLHLKLNPVESFLLNVKVTDVYSGCLDEAKIRILARQSCDEEYLFIPNVFSPNGDGINDRFNIQSQYTSEIKKLNIFDRWGQLVFSTYDMNDQWDGTFKNKELPIAIYMYVVEVNCTVDGSTYKSSGDILLLR